jgi:hypothetical protein
MDLEVFCPVDTFEIALQNLIYFSGLSQIITAVRRIPVHNRSHRNFDPPYGVSRCGKFADKTCHFGTCVGLTFACCFFVQFTFFHLWFFVLNVEVPLFFHFQLLDGFSRELVVWLVRAALFLTRPLAQFLTILRIWHIPVAPVQAEYHVLNLRFHYVRTSKHPTFKSKVKTWC